jgi:hypothetical protein
MDYEYIIPVSLDGGFNIGDEVIIGLARYRIIGMEGVFHLKKFSYPIFISWGNVIGLSRETRIADCKFMRYMCRDHVPCCEGHIRYEKVSR